MPAFVQQQRGFVGGELFVLDGYDEVDLAVEMDATVGWQTLAADGVR
jgi:hypothetical protein